MSQGGSVAASELRRVLPFIIAINHVIVLAILLLVLRGEGRHLSDIGWRLDPGQTILSELVIGLAIAVLIYLLKEVAYDSIRALIAGNRPTFTSLFRFRWNTSGLPLLVVGTTLVFVEESVYRGYGLPVLVNRVGGLGAFLIMGALFGILHWGNGVPAMLFTGTIGLIYGGVFWWRGTMAAVLVAHAVYNALVILT